MKPTDDVSQFPENGMSATPRTDEEAGYYGLGGSVSVEFARQLERELAAMKARAEKAEADTARLNWIKKEALEDWGIRSITRDAIDAAMKEASK